MKFVMWSRWKKGPRPNARWLKRGISVYEERPTRSVLGRNRRAGIREDVVNENLTPGQANLSARISQARPHQTHLQFAYYESSLVVRVPDREPRIGMRLKQI